MGEECNEFTIDPDLLISQIKREGAPPMSADTSKAMLVRIGRNLLLFNEIEVILKRVLPYMHPRDGSSDAIQKFRNELQKETLGRITKELVKSVDSPDVDGFRQYVDAFVEHRNLLVHHFLDQPGIDFSEDGARAGIRWLDKQHEFCEPMLRSCHHLLVACAYGMERAAEARGQELFVPEWRSEKPVGEP